MEKLRLNLLKKELLVEVFLLLGELNGIVNKTLREEIDKSIAGKLVNAKVNFGLGTPIRAKTNPKIY